jgi:hypothetical protein
VERRRIGPWIVALVAVALIFQFFFRYQYEHLAGGNVLRIDHLTATSCYLPCLPPPPPPPKATPTPYDPIDAELTFIRVSGDQDQKAIESVKETPLAQQIVGEKGPGYSWSARTYDIGGQFFQSAIDSGKNPFEHSAKSNLFSTPPDVNSADFQTKFVCYCNAKQTLGWMWEAHTDTGEVYYVNDNAELSKKYGTKPP